MLAPLRTQDQTFGLKWARMGNPFPQGFAGSNPALSTKALNEAKIRPIEENLTVTGVQRTPKRERTSIPKETKNQIILYCRRECCLCDKKVSGKYESNIHHINEDPTDHRFGNLILLCPNCHASATRGDFTSEQLITIRDAKIKKLGIKEFAEKRDKPERAFKEEFSSVINELCSLLDKNESVEKPHQVDDLTDRLIALVKERIEKWDVPSVRFATEETLTKLTTYSEKNGFCELYVFFEDLFRFAYIQRKHILGTMIGVFNLTLFELSINYDSEKAEKISRALLRLGLDFLDLDPLVSKDCLGAIDNLAEDEIKPEILSKEILLGAGAFEKAGESTRIADLLAVCTEYVRHNDEEAWFDADYSYILESLRYAKSEESLYNLKIKEFWEKELHPALQLNITKQVEGYIDFLEEPIDHGDIKFDKEYKTAELAKIVKIYEIVRPTIAREIKEKIKARGNNLIQKQFEELVSESNLLQKLFRGSKMISTFKELIEFLKTSSDMDNLRIGLTTYGPAWVDFFRNLSENEKKAINEIATEYKLSKDAEFELEDCRLQFLMDSLVWLGNDCNDMQKLVDFLNKVNKVSKISAFTTGIEFKLRENSRSTL